MHVMLKYFDIFMACDKIAQYYDCFTHVYIAIICISIFSCIIYYMCDIHRVGDG